MQTKVSVTCNIYRVVRRGVIDSRGLVVCPDQIRLLAAKGYREVIVTGRTLAQIKETTAQLAAETKGRSSRRWSLVWTTQATFTPPSPRLRTDSTVS